MTEREDVARAFKRIGHKGADLMTPGNTLASFDAALASGVDMVEFDVLPEHRDGTGRLLLAHDYGDAARRECLTLEEGLAHFRQDAWAGVDLDVDMKLAGYEDRVVQALRDHDLVGRALVSTMETESLPRVRALEPELRLGWSVPRVKRNWFANPVTRAPAYALLLWARRVYPERMAKAIRSGAVDAIMAHWALVTPAFAEAVLSSGGELYVWTVDDAAVIDRMSRLGVTGIISNDPRLFGPAELGALS